jgi:hypothetical protein
MAAPPPLLRPQSGAEAEAEAGEGRWRLHSFEGAIGHGDPTSTGKETGAEAEAEAGEGRPRGGLKCHLVMLYTGCGKEHR